MIGLNIGSLKEGRPHEYAMRFVFGGLCTAAAGLIAKKFGPVIGGLFLAFPAIFPASASLIESHEKRRKHEAGMHGTQRGRAAAAVDAAGAAMGALGLAAFAAVVWLLLDGRSVLWTIAAATVAWVVVSVGVWWMRRTGVHVWRRRHGVHPRPTTADGAAVGRR